MPLSSWWGKLNISVRGKREIVAFNEILNVFMRAQFGLCKRESSQ
jgi:hypothetical protein